MAPAPVLAEPPHARRGVVLALTTGAVSMTLIDMTAVAVALPTLQADLNISAGSAQWVVSAYFLALAAGVALGGRLGDSFGHGRCFLIGVAVFGAVSAVAGAAPSIEVLVAARVVQGLAAALTLPAGQALLVDTFPESQRGRALGLYIGIGSAFVSLGPLLGGWLSEDFSWRWVFLINPPIALAVLATGLFALRTESQAPTRSPLDVPGGLLLAGVMVALVLGIGAAGTSAPTIAVIAAAAIAIVLGIVLRAFERRAPKPLLSATLLRRAAFAGGLAVSACLQLALIGLVVYGAAWLQDGLDLSPLTAGAAVLPATLTFLVVAPFGGAVADRAGSRMPMVAGTALLTAALAWLAVTVPDNSYALLLPGFVLAGAGLGLAVATTTRAVLSAAPERERGGASGLLYTSQQFGSALGAALLGAVLVAVERSALDHHLDTITGATPTLRAQAEQALRAHDVTAGLPAAIADAVTDALGSGTAAAFAVGGVAALVACAVAYISQGPRKRRQSAPHPQQGAGAADEHPART